MVRKIDKDGDIYEGNVTSDGKKNGWGILYSDENEIEMGWYKNGYRNGNVVTFNASDLSVNYEKTGWFEDYEKKGNLKDHPILKKIEL